MNKVKTLLLSAFSAVAVFYAAPAVQAQSSWKQSSFSDFIEGTFTDAGSNCYVSRNGRIQIITRYDFNNDGKLDFFLPAGHGQTEKENIYIYLNNGKDIDERSRLQLPGGGSYGGVVADLNKDGFNDLAVVNFRDSHVPKVPAWVYYGSKEGFSASRRAELPAAEGRSIAVGDFNGDSWQDVAIGCRYFEDNEDESAPRKSFIYWNSPEGFSADNRLTMSFDGMGSVGVVSGDIDQDGKDDLVVLTNKNIRLLLSSRNDFKNPEGAAVVDIKGSSAAIGDINNDQIPDIAVCKNKEVEIIRGLGKGKFNLSEPILLQVSGPRSIVLCDVDKDGFDDAVVANYETSGGANWTKSFVFYSNGTDFSSRKPAELPTIGANFVSCGDLNADGYPEIVFSNQNLLNENNLLSYVYWNEKGSFRFENHTQLQTQGSSANTIGDVNNDGKPDVVFFNDEGYYRDGPTTSSLYWGDGTRSFSEEKSIKFFTHQVFGFGNADLDDDGNVDIIMALQKFRAGVDHDQSGLEIEWNNNGSFEEKTNLTMGVGYGGVRIADINKDGYLDLLGSGHCIDLEGSDKKGFPIFWGSENGYSFKNRSVLHITRDRMRGPLLMDLNNDGWLDIAGQYEWGKVRFWWGSREGFSDDRHTDLKLPRNDELMYIKGADFNKDGWLDLLLPHRGNPDGTRSTSYIYYGSPAGFSNDKMIQIDSYVPYQNSIADFNNDGWLDMFLTSYGGEVSGNRPSLLYYGSKEGFSTSPAELETYGSSGSTALDFDGDGWLDLLIINHRSSGSYVEPRPHRHTCPSFLYWGGPDGFSEKNRAEFIVAGPSGLNLRDPGNSYDRKYYEDYFSPVHKIAEDEFPSAIKWNADTPFGTAVNFQIRVAETEKDLDSAEWTGISGEGSWFTESGSRLDGVSGKFIQYRARLITPNDAATPYLNSVEISFNAK